MWLHLAERIRQGISPTICDGPTPREKTGRTATGTLNDRPAISKRNQLNPSLRNASLHELTNKSSV